MTPAARTQAAIELLDAIVDAARDGGPAADTLIARYFAARRYAGSKDRRAVREIVYRAVRMLGERPASGRAAVLALAGEDPEIAAHFGAGGHGPAERDAREPVAEKGIAPDWLLAELAASGIEGDAAQALLTRAPLDLRVNAMRATREVTLGAFPGAKPIAHTTHGIRLTEDAAVENHPLFASGAVEVQDAGSQRVSIAAGVAPGMTVIDLCAGAGGKTLALGAAMNGQGRIVAADVDRARLSRLTPRAERAGLSIVETRLMNPGQEAGALEDLAGGADLVLVDAPCSGTGTWRRNPEARWRLTEERLQRLVDTQARLLDIAAPLVRAGGSIGYITCSLLDREGSDQAAGFLTRHDGWRAEDVGSVAGTVRGAGRRLDPHAHGTDGFFFARLRGPC